MSVKQSIVLNGGDAVLISFPHSFDADCDININPSIDTQSQVEKKHLSTNGKDSRPDDDSNSPSSSAVFHTPWLWMNDAKSFMIPSGQRISHPGSFNRQTKIQNAILELQPYAASLKGSVRPLDCIQQGEADSDDASNKEWTLVITWSNNATKEKEQGGSKVQTSHFNLNWLKQWSYDCHSIKQAIQNREVNITHTFLHKFQHDGHHQADHHNHTSTNSSTRCSRGVRWKKYRGIGHVPYSKIDQFNNDEQQPPVVLDDDSKAQEDGLFDMLDSIFLDGAVLVTDVPNVSAGPNTSVTEIGEVSFYIIILKKIFFNL